MKTFNKNDIKGIPDHVTGEKADDKVGGEVSSSTSGADQPRTRSRRAGDDESNDADNQDKENKDENGEGTERRLTRSQARSQKKGDDGEWNGIIFFIL